MRNCRFSPVAHGVRVYVGIVLVSAGLTGTAQAKSYAYITNGGSNTVSVIDTATNAVVATVTVGAGPSGVAVNPAGTRVYVANQSSN